MNVEIELPSGSLTQQNMREADAQLAELKLDEQLVPLMIERNKYAAQFGDEHPAVLQLDTELTLMKTELKRIVRQQTDRIVELMNEAKADPIDPSAVAQEAVNTIIYASRAEIALLRSKIKELDQQIETEKQGAIQLAKYEQDNLAMLREIEHNRELLDQLESVV